MSRGPRTRTRLLVAFLGTYVLLAVLGGAIAWRLLDRMQAQQAEERARTVAQLSGFFHSELIRRQVEDLTGYRIEVATGAVAPRDGTVQVQDDLGRTLVVDYRNPAYTATREAVLLATVSFIVAGVLLVAMVSWLVAANTARPLELLAVSARRLGDGRLDQPVPQVGSGEIADLAADLEVMRSRLVDLDHANRQSERLTTLGTFTAVIAHEIRNPLSAVKLSLQLMARRPDADPMLGTLLDELERLDLIVDELLAFSRGISVSPVPCALHEVAADVARLLKRQADHAGVTLAISGETRLQADPARLRQLLLNLMLNAIQAQHAAGGAVRVVLTTDGLRVEDDGPGIPPEQRERLFDAFTSTRPGGTGLGLHIAHAIAAAHGARLVYRERAGKASFSVEGLDAAQSPEQTGSQGAEEPE